MKDEDKMNEVLIRLENKFDSKDQYIRDAFQVLIATILSQNTSDRNAQRAFSQLRERFDLRPKVLASLKSEDIKPAIMCAGLSSIKSQRIVEVSNEILTRFDGDLTKIFNLSLNEARNMLISLKGIGPKTADVFLSFVGRYPVMAVDTNIFRVVDRIGFVKGRNYERTRKALEALIPPEKLLEAHSQFINLGRNICKPRNPQCSTCPVNTLCDLYKVN